MARGRIEFDDEKCKGCSLCVEFCPTNILALDIEQINKRGYFTIRVLEPDKCIACAFCAIMCPDSVITVYRFEKEKA